MNLVTSSFGARARNVFHTFWALPAFVLITLIPWLLAVHALVRSRRYYEAGQGGWGMGFKLAGYGVAGLTAFATLWFVGAWIVMLVRAMRGVETRE